MPSLVTFETEQTWAPETESTGSPSLDVASYLHFVSLKSAYGSHGSLFPRGSFGAIVSGAVLEQFVSRVLSLCGAGGWCLWREVALMRSYCMYEHPVMVPYEVADILYHTV